MRVPNISNYVNSTYRLGSLTSSLQKANEVVSTQKQINEISDDPLGLSQVLTIRNSIGTLDQIERNVIMGKSWLEGAESSLDSVNTLILDAKTEVSRLANSSATADERKDAVERINSILEQIVSLGNTQVNGNYIFGGTDTNVIPFEYDQSGTGQVVYKGNNIPFEIRTDKNSGVQVGRDGKETFWDREIEINATNNTIVFKEDNGHGSGSQIVLTATVPDGLYTSQKLETAVRNALNEASSQNGYGAGYLVDYNSDDNTYAIREDGSFNGYLKTEFMWDTGGQAYINNIAASSSIDPDDIQISVDAGALTISTPEPAGTNPFRLVWQGDDTWKIVNNPGYVIVPSTISGTKDSIDIDLNESGTADIRIRLDAPVNNKGDYIEFEIVSAKGDRSIGHEIGYNGTNTIQAPPVSDYQAQYITELVIADGTNDQIVFDEVNSTGGASTFTIDLNTTGADITYVDMNTLASSIETRMEAASAAGPNSIDYNVSYDPVTSRFKIKEAGSDLDEFHIQWSASNAADTLGFYPVDDLTIYPASDIALDRTIVLDNSNNTFSFQEIDALGTAGTALTATVAAGTYRDATSFAAAVELALDAATANVPPADYDVTYNAGNNQFTIQDVSGNISEFRLLWDSGGPDSDYLAKSLGFSPDVDYDRNLSYSSSVDPVVMTFDKTNNWIDFSETDADGNRVTASIQIPEGDYTSRDQLAAVIQTRMREASFNNVDYAVSYDAVEGEFIFKEGGIADISSFSLLWYSGDNPSTNAADTLGFVTTSDDTVRLSMSDENIVNITIDGSNNKIDFLEFNRNNPNEYPNKLTASIAQKTYSSHAELAREVEKAMEAESRNNGNAINYTVAWDDHTQKFTIKENGSMLDELRLQWNTGNNAPVSIGGTGQTIGAILGFDSLEDDVHTPLKSQRPVEWGIFNTLLDLKQYLSDNDTDGIERSIGRLETNFDNMTSRIVDIGMKYNRLEVRETITREVSLSLTTRKSSIEDADIIESIMKLQSIETAYQAALASTSKILNISLVDYLT
ncbi:MAG: flagellar hook-associated protein FlgL [Proteobacteria bacterium]|nr:flagellar hook-associated protein FlgL [Pseudomonadota bacterium]MBU1388929.1 flagellar hook-associated protein FlgL [Pseudomonadota bacterium]MBU1543481.1 flagellar hook-associated protein FlgL [Pseudomonadota bacterium]MBU2431024.1 flagellar hook-associated protein FlgL [Pseudomonadota bacterium]MBU2480227.1 flagellar hook-associated protein FlgL [Pseudomonadota bacterium]